MSTTTTEPQVFDQGSRPPRHPVWAGVAGVVVVLLCLAAIGVALHSRVHTASTAPAVTTPTTEAPPALATTGAEPDWDAVVRSILAYDNWLRVHPDPTKVADIYDPSNPDYSTVVAAIGALANGDRRYVIGPDPKPVEVITMQARDERSASVFVRYGPLPAARVVDRTGHVISDLPARAGTFTWWRLVLGDDGRWRLAGTRES